jgi:hypothetical protein
MILHSIYLFLSKSIFTTTPPNINFNLSTLFDFQVSNLPDFRSEGAYWSMKERYPTTIPRDLSSQLKDPHHLTTISQQNRFQEAH